MPEDLDLKGHALSLPSKTNQIDRASKLVKLNDGRATPSQAVNVASPMSVPPPSSAIPGRQPLRIEETPDAGKQATQVLNFSVTYLSNSFLLQLWVIFSIPYLVDIMCELKFRICYVIISYYILFEDEETL